MAKEIKIREGMIQIRPIQHYSTVGGVDINLNKQRFAPEDDEMGSLSCFCHYVGDKSKNENAFTLQLRAFKQLTPTSKAKGIIMSLSLNDSDIMALAKMVIDQRKKYETIAIAPKNKEDE